MQFSIDTKQALSCCNEMSNMIQVIRRDAARIEDIASFLNERMDFSEISFSKELFDESSNLMKEFLNLHVLENGLRRIVHEYENKETDVANFEAGITLYAKKRYIMKIGRVCEELDCYIDSENLYY